MQFDATVSTVRKLTRRIGPETVAEMTRAMIVVASREKRFRPRAVRIDSTVIEADIKHPTDAGLASVGVRVLAREGRRLGRLVQEKKVRVRDRSRAMGQKMRGMRTTTSLGPTATVGKPANVATGDSVIVARAGVGME